MQGLNGEVTFHEMAQDFERPLEISSYDLSDIVDRYFDTSRYRDLRVDVLRLDKVHPFISGNKWFKLKHYLLSASQQNISHLVSFGGPFSNHLHALAYAGYLFGFRTTGIVRGHAPPSDKLSPTLQDCLKWGMSLEWMDRQDYRRHAEVSGVEHVQALFPQSLVIPEGGEGADGVEGVASLFQTLDLDRYDLILTPVGSGTTLAGLHNGVGDSARVVGVSALKGADDLSQRAAKYIPDKSPEQVEIWHDYHHGGFAKMTPLLRNFISSVQSEYGLMLDPVYTSKALYALVHQFAHHKLGESVNAMLIHTGGLQGWRGFRSS
jgi:1-aminocyclopropane-1-carboxylate deaminase/D-cysteine desulfhydrase-like pyridoxal-dependent ACC family enzyme